MDKLLNARVPGKTKVEGFFRRIVTAVTAYRDHRDILLKAVLVGFVIHVSTVFMYYFCALAVGADASLGDMLFVGPWIILATVGLPTIAGECAREFTTLGILSRIGVNESAA